MNYYIIASLIGIFFLNGFNCYGCRDNSVNADCSWSGNTQLGFNLSHDTVSEFYTFAWGNTILDYLGG